MGEKERERQTDRQTGRREGEERKERDVLWEHFMTVLFLPYSAFNIATAWSTCSANELVSGYNNQGLGVCLDDNPSQVSKSYLSLSHPAQEMIGSTYFSTFSKYRLWVENLIIKRF